MRDDCDGTATDDGRVLVYDTTLRDGTQREGISLSTDDKLRIARRLDDMGVAYIEGGWPGSNPKDAAFFARALRHDWKHARLTAFGATCRVGSRPEDDPNLAALLEAGTAVCALVGKTSPLHVREVLQTTLDENLRLVRDSVAFLVAHGREVVFDAEHFFDGFREDRSYALAVLAVAAEAGAANLTLCDTNGGSLPWEVEEVTHAVAADLQRPLGIHTHDDSGCAVANTLAAVRAGAVLVQGTVNGYGERCGNANLCVAVPDLELKLGRRCLPAGRLGQLRELALFVSEVANLAPDTQMPFVGANAFTHKGGLHVAAMRRSGRAYHHVDPPAVGNRMRVVVSELAGRGNLVSAAEELGVAIAPDCDVAAVLAEIKELEHQGFSFEAATASVVMLLERRSPGYRPPFALVDYTAYVEHRHRRGMVTEATVKLRVGDEVVHTAAEGNGPVNALDGALRKALAPAFPEIAAFHLADYKVRILDGRNGTAATTRVLVDTRHDGQRWSTVGASANIIEASWQALADGIEFGLLRARAAEPARHQAEASGS